jgi:hypothetical protein
MRLDAGRSTVSSPKKRVTAWTTVTTVTPTTSFGKAGRLPQLTHGGSGQFVAGEQTEVGADLSHADGTPPNGLVVRTISTEAEIRLSGNSDAHSTPNPALTDLAPSSNPQMVD